MCFCTETFSVEVCELFPRTWITLGVWYVTQRCVSDKRPGDKIKQFYVISLCQQFTEVLSVRTTTTYNWFYLSGFFMVIFKTSFWAMLGKIAAYWDIIKLRMKLQMKRVLVSSSQGRHLLLNLAARQAHLSHRSTVLTPLRRLTWEISFIHWGASHTNRKWMWKMIYLFNITKKPSFSRHIGMTLMNLCGTHTYGDIACGTINLRADSHWLKMNVNSFSVAQR